MKSLYLISFFLFISIDSFSTQRDTLYFEAIDLPSDISIPNITSINKDKVGNLWITTLDGLYRYDGYEVMKYFNNENESFGLIKNLTFNTHLSDDGTFWIVGSYSIYRYDYKTERLLRVSEHEKNNFNDLYDIIYFDIEDINSKYMAVGCKAGLKIYDKASQVFIKYDSLTTNYIKDPYSTNAHVLQIKKDPINPDVLWLLTKSGLFKFDCLTLETEFVFYDRSMQFDELKDRGFDMIVKEDYIYLLLNFKHLHKYDRQTKRASRITQEFNGNSAIHKRNILPADDGFYIVYIGNGIHNYKESINDIVPIENRFINGTDCKGHSYTMLDSNNRFVSVHQNKSIIISKTDGQIHRKQQNVFTKSMNVGGFSYEDTIKDDGIHTLETYQRDLEFDIGLTNRDYRDKESYYYAVNDTQSWNIVNTNHLKLNNLSAGNHDVFVKIVSNGNAYRKKVKSFRVKPYFYETTWFALLVILGCIGVISIISYLINIRKRENKIYKEKMFELEMNALRSQMNPHFLFNSINSIKSYVITSDKDAAAEYLTQFAKLIRMILENSRKKLLVLEEEVEMLKLYVVMEQKRLNFSFDFKFEISDEIDPNFLIAPMLIQPYVENAIWHGLMNKDGEKSLNIKFEEHENGILVSIVDNGIGRIASKNLNAENKTSKKSLGLKITEDRIKMIKEMYNIDASVNVEDLYNSNGDAIGTYVKIFLPHLKGFQQHD